MENQTLVWTSLIGSLLGLALVTLQNLKDQREKAPVKIKSKKRK